MAACHVIRGFFPALLNVAQQQPDELGSGLLTGKVAAHAHRLTDLSIKALDGLGGVKNCDQLSSEGVPCLRYQLRFQLCTIAGILPPRAAIEIMASAKTLSRN